MWKAAELANSAIQAKPNRAMARRRGADSPAPAARICRPSQATQPKPARCSAAARPSGVSPTAARAGRASGRAAPAPHPGSTSSEGQSPLLQRRRVALGKPCFAHGPRGALVVVVQRVVADPQPARLGCQHGEPAARRAVIGGHADGARIVPEGLADQAREGQAAMAGDDALRAGRGDLLGQRGVGRGGEQEAADVARPAMHHRQAPPAEGDVDPPGQRCHPGAMARGHLGARMGVPAARQQVAGGAGLEAAAAILRVRPRDSPRNCP
jgi:hypothetical protein